MKCGKCFFCCQIGYGIYGDFKVVFCKYRKEAYKLPKDKSVYEVGCCVHFRTVERARRKYIKEMEKQGEIEKGKKE